MKRQNPFSQDNAKLVDEIVAAADQSSDQYLGLRVDDGRRILDGEYFPNSRRWDDGRVTDEELSGTSTIYFDNDVTREEVVRKLEILAPYIGDTLTLVGGRGVEIGEDEGEGVLRDGRAIRSWSAEDAHPKVGP